MYGLLAVEKTESNLITDLLYVIYFFSLSESW